MAPALTDPNEMGMTIVDQAHTIRLLGARCAELEGENRVLRARLEAIEVAKDLTSSQDDAGPDAPSSEGES